MAANLPKAVLAGLLSFLPVAVAAAPCATPQPGSQQNVYQFTYSSWVKGWQQPQSNMPFTYGAEITNLGPKGLFFNWPDLQFQGTVETKRTASFTVSAPLDDCENFQSSLWYGDRPELKTTGAVRAKRTDLSSVVLRVAREKLLEIFKAQGKVFGTSSGRSHLQAGNRGQFVDFETSFFSEVSQGDSKLGLTVAFPPESRRIMLSAFADAPDDKAVLHLVIEDGFVAAGLKMPRMTVRKRDLRQEVAQRAFEARELPRRSETTYRVGKLLILDGDERLIGATPLGVLEPASPPETR